MKKAISKSAPVEMYMACLGRQVWLKRWVHADERCKETKDADLSGIPWILVWGTWILLWSTHHEKTVKNFRDDLKKQCI